MCFLHTYSRVQSDISSLSINIIAFAYECSKCRKRAEFLHCTHNVLLFKRRIHLVNTGMILTYDN